MQGSQQLGTAEAQRLLRRQLVYTSCAYSSIILCVEGSSAFLHDHAPVLQELTGHASGLGVSLSILTSGSSATTMVRMQPSLLSRVHA